MKYSDERLQKALTKMLPSRLLCYTKSDHDGYTDEYQHFEWKSDDFHDHYTPVQEPEMLYICYLIEEEIWNDRDLSAAYCLALDYICQPKRDLAMTDLGYTGWIAHATWQQRTMALAKVKKIKI